MNSDQRHLATLEGIKANYEKALAKHDADVRRCEQGDDAAAIQEHRDVLLEQIEMLNELITLAV